MSTNYVCHKLPIIPFLMFCFFCRQFAFRGFERQFYRKVKLGRSGTVEYGKAYVLHFVRHVGESDDNILFR